MPTTSIPLVVVVEDDLTSRRALGRLLRAGGFEAACYPSAEEFLESPPGRPPVCLVLDISLGGMSGIDLQRRLRASGSDVSVILLTGLDDPGLKEEATELGCAAYLSKSSDGHTLLALLRSLSGTTKGR